MSSNAKSILYKEMREPERRPADSSFQTGRADFAQVCFLPPPDFLCFWALSREFVFFLKPEILKFTRLEPAMPRPYAIGTAQDRNGPYPQVQ
jgi:hypothetical protein